MVVTPTERVANVFVVLNPVAGRETTQDIRALLESCFAPEQWACDFYETTGEEQLDTVVHEALERGVDLVVAVGGDGTVSSVANGLAQSGVPLGIVPIGTANVLAQELNIPLDLEAACRLFSEAHSIRCLDAMQVQDRLYILHIGIGIESLMIRDTKRQSKRRFGRLAYMWTAVKWMIGYQPRRFTIAVDGQRLRPRSAQVLLANGGTLGMKPFRWGPDIFPDDRHIDVCIVNARTILDYVRAAWEVLVTRHGNRQKVRYLQAEKSISVSADTPLPVQGDGEIIGETPVHVQVIPSAIQVIVPVNIENEHDTERG